MLTGPALGKAIEEARKLKRVTKVAMATHFEVEPPSIQDWVKRGTIDKAKLPKLWAYFADVVGPAHWGLPAEQHVPSAMSPIHDAVESLASALMALDTPGREAAAKHFHTLAEAPDSQIARRKLIAALAVAGIAKRRAQA